VTTGFDVSTLRRWSAVPLRLIVGYGFIAHGYAKVVNGPQFGPPGYETDLLYIAALATLVLGGSGPFALQGRLPSFRRTDRVQGR
jgi:uncharacterized membrane protein YphA (DoxX/SURF4 family)